MLITNRINTPVNKYLKFIETCAKSGISYLQLREKSASHDFLINFGKDIQSILKPLSIPLIINDNLNLALELDAEGIHLGQGDTDPFLTRKLLGKQKIIGLSIETLSQLEIANQLNCIDYVAASSVYATKTKKDIQTIWGTDKLKYFCALSKYPVIGIGGIDITNIKDVMQAKVSGVAIISAIHEALNPKEYITELMHMISTYSKESK